ncbi:MAG: hypothetical protein AAB425_03850, partial [Bdellovibrionota bacterium]
MLWHITELLIGTVFADVAIEYSKSPAEIRAYLERSDRCISTVTGGSKRLPTNSVCYPEWKGAANKILNGLDPAPIFSNPSMKGKENELHAQYERFVTIWQGRQAQNEVLTDSVNYHPDEFQMSVQNIIVLPELKEPEPPQYINGK